jgi:hypothetical protein
MNKILALLLSLVAFGAAQIPTVTLKHVFAIDSTPKIRYVYENDTILANRIIQIRDSVNGDSTKTLIKSLGSLRLTLDNDNNETGARLAITHNGGTDTIFKAQDDLSSKFFGAVSTGALSSTTGSFSGKVVGSDTIRADGAIVGRSNIFASGSNLGYWLNTPGTFTYGMHQTGTSLAFRSGSTSPWLTVDASGLPTFANAVSMSSTLGVAGNFTLADRFIWSGSAANMRFATSDGADNGRLTISTGGADNGNPDRGPYLSIQGNENVGTGNIRLAAGNVAGGIIVLATGNNVPAVTINETQGVSLSSTLGVIGAITASGGVDLAGGSTGRAAGRIYTTASSGTVIWAKGGSSSDFVLANSAGDNVMTVAAGSTAATFTAPPVFSSVTASQALEVDASKGLVSVAKTGTGNDVYSTSPTLTTPVLGAATATSIQFPNSTTASNGTVFKHANTGITIKGIAGSTHDFALEDPSGAHILRVPTGTLNVDIPNGNLTVSAGNITASGTVTADSLISTKFYDEGSFTVTATGLTTILTGTAFYVRVGKSVTLHIPSILGTSNANTFTMTGLPASIRPSYAVDIPNTGMENNGAIVGTESGLSVRVQNSTTIEFWINNTSTGWTSTPTGKGSFRNLAISYTLQ